MYLHGPDCVCVLRGIAHAAAGVPEARDIPLPRGRRPDDLVRGRVGPGGRDPVDKEQERDTEQEHDESGPLGLFEEVRAEGWDEWLGGAEEENNELRDSRAREVGD